MATPTISEQIERIIRDRNDWLERAIEDRDSAQQRLTAAELAIASATADIAQWERVLSEQAS